MAKYMYMLKIILFMGGFGSNQPGIVFDDIQP